MVNFSSSERVDMVLVLEEQLDVEVSLGEQVRMWYLHDGTPPHFDRPVTEWLNNHFSN